MHRLTYPSFWYRIPAHYIGYLVSPNPETPLFYPVLRINFQNSAGVREGSPSLARDVVGGAEEGRQELLQI